MIEDRMDTCLPGLQGFPVQITGWSGIQAQDKVDLVIPNDIHIQFSQVRAHFLGILRTARSSQKRSTKQMDILDMLKSKDLKQRQYKEPPGQV